MFRSAALRIFLVMWPLVFFVGCTKEDAAPAPTGEVILEVMEDRIGLWDIHGESLYFRLYENGFAEFDWLDKSIGSNFRKTSDVAKRLSVQLDSNRVGEYTEILSVLRNSESEYKRKCCCTDASLSYTILAKQNSVVQSTVLRGFCSNLQEPANPMVSADFLRLFEKIESDRARKILRKAGPNPTN